MLKNFFEQGTKKWQFKHIILFLTFLIFLILILWNIIFEKDIKRNSKTLVVPTNSYHQCQIDDVSSAIFLIKQDSFLQKEKCPFRMKNLEQVFEKKFQIYGVNLCELSPEIAVKIFNVLEKIYLEYPWIKGYVTNLSLKNSDNYIAQFEPASIFATGNSSSLFPMVIKMQIFLNAKYYLDVDQLNEKILLGIKDGYFLKDTTAESLIAHEYGHVITYVLAIKYYDSVNPLLLLKKNYSKYEMVLKYYNNSFFSNMLLEEAYSNYIRDNSFLTKEDFIKSISGYAIKKDYDGLIISNEVIAEAFHDFFLNGAAASNASISIMEVLNQYIFNYVSSNKSERME